MTAAEIGPVRAVSASAAMTATATMHSKTILAAIALVMTVLPRILLRLLPPATRDERGKAAYLLSPFMAALVVRLLVLLRLMMLRTVVQLLIPRRERLRIARQIRLLLRFARRVARLVLAHEWLGIIILAVKSFVGVLLARRALLLRLLVVIRVLLTELLLGGSDQAKVMLGMLIIILSGHRIAGALCVAGELDIFFRNMRGSAANFDVGTV